MTTLKIEGRTAMPAEEIAMTKGEYFVFAPEALMRLGFVEGTSRPTKVRERM